MPEEDSLFDNDKVTQTADYESKFDHIVDNVRRHLDMKLVYDILDKGVE